MAKRFTDGEIWQKDWFLSLELKQKLLVKYIFDNCDCAGVYEISYRTLSNIFGCEITKADFLAIKQVKFVAENKIFIEDFIPFQYGVEISELNEKYSVHKGIIKKLNKINYFETLNQPLSNSTFEELQDKDKVKDKDNISHNVIEEEKEIKKEKEESFIPKLIKNNSNLLYDAKIKKLFEIYKENCKELIPVRFEKRNLEFLAMLSAFLSQIDSDFEYFTNLCIKANKLKKIVKNKIDLKMLINNHERISSGFYDTGQKETQEEFIERMRREMSND